MAGRQHAEAESSLMQALAVAQRQKSVSLELRAALSLSRLWQKTGQAAKAKKLLETVTARSKAFGGGTESIVHAQ
jgi:adenylate cyclase